MQLNRGKLKGLKVKMMKFRYSYRKFAIDRSGGIQFLATHNF